MTFTSRMMLYPGVSVGTTIIENAACAGAFSGGIPARRFPGPAYLEPGNGQVDPFAVEYGFDLVVQVPPRHEPVLPFHPDAGL